MHRMKTFYMREHKFLLALLLLLSKLKWKVKLTPNMRHCIDNESPEATLGMKGKKLTNNFISRFWSVSLKFQIFFYDSHIQRGEKKLKALSRFHSYLVLCFSCISAHETEKRVKIIFRYLSSLWLPSLVKSKFIPYMALDVIWMRNREGGKRALSQQ